MFLFIWKILTKIARHSYEFNQENHVIWNEFCANLFKQLAFLFIWHSCCLFLQKLPQKITFFFFKLYYFEIFSDQIKETIPGSRSCICFPIPSPLSFIMKKISFESLCWLQLLNANAESEAIILIHQPQAI